MAGHFCAPGPEFDTCDLENFRMRLQTSIKASGFVLFLQFPDVQFKVTFPILADEVLDKND